MIERYIYAVTRELPKASREKISQELRTTIREKMDSLDSNMLEQEKKEHVLRELGDPKLLANSYRGKERYLIGPLYFDKYLSVLKIVSLSILIGISVAFGVATIISIESLTESIGSYTSRVVSAILQGVIWVTGIFALLEYYDVSVDKDTGKDTWDPTDLPVLPEKKAEISRGESIFSIIFITIILSLFFISPDKIGFYYKAENQARFLPLFNIQALALFRYLISVVFILNILIEVIKLIKARWTFKLAIAVTALNIIAAVLLITAISNPKIWNNDIVNQFEQYANFPFNRIIVLMTGIIIITTTAESAGALYKGYRYGNGPKD